MITLENIHKLLGQIKAKTNHDEFVIMGSLSILGSSIRPPRQMAYSIDVDLYLKSDPNRHLEITQVGEDSSFRVEHGYYADPITPQLVSLPEGWEDRLIKKDFGDLSAYFLDPNDCAVSKYIRGQENDLRWVREGIKTNILDISKIERRLPTANCLDGEVAAARKLIQQDKRLLSSSKSKDLGR